MTELGERIEESEKRHKRHLVENKDRCGSSGVTAAAVDGELTAMADDVISTVTLTPLMVSLCHDLMLCQGLIVSTLMRWFCYFMVHRAAKLVSNRTSVTVGGYVCEGPGEN
ncbi:hypothetical protein RRG08_034481 [Elysia crispata]|uniref:Uncharacterized protein n=1 Tax=Elysia crispata TaxID=231223 RepID=A0AAE0ZH85_9GAST|nr:hypothetical protein RRG08_034481 [Elysia crispata]